ncbi:rho guanine nucleotide exchange factor 18-like isoform X2 [Hypomesus transpacificus]|uniref:rho guanine nucleotide exchange factor 18-like isoform X2 n=1 Tax=Hypomesus transpacificus TaxID=137520 RepID=UPI001F07DD90|nr:rho guanine nucleotide exchange factor 18-like isoform X2 [Hypomesus transpacificus]
MTVTSARPSPEPDSSTLHTSLRSRPVPMEELDAPRAKPFAEEAAVSPAPAVAADSINPEDAHYVALQGELEADAQDLEEESWSVAVEQPYLKSLSKEEVKRQDVIYELIVTELHHVRTLKLLQRVYLHELQEALQMEEAKLERLFPAVHTLLQLHQTLLDHLKHRRLQALEPHSSVNYRISHLGDLLIAQFSGEQGQRMRDSYGVFCGHHNDAVSLYKEQLQNNKKFQNLIRKIGLLPIVRRRGIPECILLVTQRITKYPVLVERIIQYTEDTEEHESLVQALGLVKDTISQVDSQVHEYETAARLREIASRLEPKPPGRTKDGRAFRREDVARRTLLHEGPLTWKAPSGRQKDIHVVLLSDVLLMLQDKDQKLTFATLDNKPSVVSLQRLIVREMALEGRGMFLICATSSMPEMYEIYAGSKQECETWMTLIRGAVDSCPEGEEELGSEQEEAARVSRLKDFQERLLEKDAQVVLSLAEKLQIFTEFAELVPGVEDATSHCRLLLTGNASDLQQGEQLLRGAITDDGSVGERPASDEGSPVEGVLCLTSDPQLQNPDPSESVELSADETTYCWVPACSSVFPEAEFFDRVLKLSQRLYSLQAIISQQDSHMALLSSERERPARQRGSVLLEQEKQRNLEKQREELASFHKLQAQQRQEQARWEREAERQRLQAQEDEAQLRLREEESRRRAELLAEERAELEGQREAYQQDLERLRESTRAVEKERERLEMQKKLKKHNTISNPGHFNYEAAAQNLTGHQSFRGDLLASARDSTLSLRPTKTRVRPGIPSIPVSGAFLEVPPEVPPRKESISPLTVKAEVPLHLVSTTNQALKPGQVQQQIPTKLAALSKGKERSSKAKGSHQRTRSAATIEVSQVLPIRVTVKEGGSLRAKKTESPKSIRHSDCFRAPEVPANVKPSQSFSVHKRSSLDSPPEPPPFPKDITQPSQETVVFL